MTRYRGRGSTQGGRGAGQRGQSQPGRLRHASTQPQPSGGDHSLSQPLPSTSRGHNSMSHSQPAVPSTSSGRAISTNRRGKNSQGTMKPHHSKPNKKRKATPPQGPKPKRKRGRPRKFMDVDSSDDDVQVMDQLALRVAANCARREANYPDRLKKFI